METSLVTIKARIAEDESDRRQGPRLPVDLEAKMRELGRRRMLAGRGATIPTTMSAVTVFSACSNGGSTRAAMTWLFWVSSQSETASRATRVSSNAPAPRASRRVRASGVRSRRHWATAIASVAWMAKSVTR